MAGKGQKRKDKDRIVLRTGEGQRPNGTYEYRWTDKTGKRRRVYAKTLEELRDKEKEIEKDKSDGIKAEARYVTVNELFDLWKQIKRGLQGLQSCTGCRWSVRALPSPDEHPGSSVGFL